jgi:hypothetical protein
MKKLFFLLFIVSGKMALGQDICPPQMTITTTNQEDDLYFSDIANLDCASLGTTLSVVVDGQTFEYTLNNCSGMQAFFDKVTGEILPFDQDEEIVVTFEDGSVGTYIATGVDETILQSCDAPSPIPTLSQWGFILLFLLASIFGILGLHKRGKEIFVVN